MDACSTTDSSIFNPPDHVKKNHHNFTTNYLHWLYTLITKSHKNNNGFSSLNVILYFSIEEKKKVWSQFFGVLKAQARNNNNLKSKVRRKYI